MKASHSLLGVGPVELRVGRRAGDRAIAGQRQETLQVCNLRIMATGGYLGTERLGECRIHGLGLGLGSRCRRRDRFGVVQDSLHVLTEVAHVDVAGVILAGCPLLVADHALGAPAIVLAHCRCGLDHGVILGLHRNVATAVLSLEAHEVGVAISVIGARPEIARVVLSNDVGQHSAGTLTRVISPAVADHDDRAIRTNGPLAQRTWKVSLTVPIVEISLHRGRAAVRTRVVHDDTIERSVGTVPSAIVGAPTLALDHLQAGVLEDSHLGICVHRLRHHLFPYGFVGTSLTSCFGVGTVLTVLTGFVRAGVLATAFPKVEVEPQL